MASYIDLFAGDQERVERAIRDLINRQEARIAELQATLATDSNVLDVMVVRTVVFRNVFGSSQTETLNSESDTEEASKPVTEGVRLVERETMILDAFRRALDQLLAGSPIEDLGKSPQS